MDPAVGQPDPERSSREAELFQERLSRSIESEGILDRALVPLTEIAGNLERAVAEIRKGPIGDPAPDDLLRWHTHLFRRTKLPIVGRFRTEADPPVGFAVPVLDDRGEQLDRLSVPVSQPAEISARLEQAFGTFSDRVQTAAAGAESAEAVAELWTTVLRTHPFADGNTRTSFVMLQAALHRLGEAAFVTGPYDWELAVARSYALRPDDAQSIEPLAKLIAARITTGTTDQ